MEKDAERATSKLINKQSPKDVSIVSEPTENEVNWRNSEYSWR